jgi:site-specific recombinase XerD
LRAIARFIKQRYTILARHSLRLLEEHWRANRPTSYFFFGRDKFQPMSAGTAQAIYYQALKRSGVRNLGGIHTLRHCFASHALHNGHRLFAVKRWLGHSHSKTGACASPTETGAMATPRRSRRSPPRTSSSASSTTSCPSTL